MRLGVGRAVGKGVGPDEGNAERKGNRVVHSGAPRREHAIALPLVRPNAPSRLASILARAPLQLSHRGGDERQGDEERARDDDLGS